MSVVPTVSCLFVCRLLALLVVPLATVSAFAGGSGAVAQAAMAQMESITDATAFHGVTPDYPAEWRAERRAADVKLTVRVARNGLVSTAQIVGSDAIPAELAERIQAEVRNWRIWPTLGTQCEFIEADQALHLRFHPSFSKALIVEGVAALPGPEHDQPLNVDEFIVAAAEVLRGYKNANLSVLTSAELDVVASTGEVQEFRIRSIELDQPIRSMEERNRYASSLRKGLFVARYPPREGARLRRVCATVRLEMRDSERRPGEE